MWRLNEVIQSLPLRTMLAVHVRYTLVLGINAESLADTFRSLSRSCIMMIQLSKTSAG